jgi:hypothetical protein
VLQTKRCIRCEQTKPVEEFSRQSAAPDGRHAYCKTCASVYARERRQPKVPLPARVCPVCKIEFIPNSRKHVYCSRSCKQTAHYRFRHPKDGRRCQACGKDISPMRSDAKWCDDACSRAGRPQRKEIALRCRLKTQYGMTLEDYNAMVERQGGGCAICGTTEIRGYGKRQAIDHCHDSNRVRGILCGNCNRGLGAFNHDPDLLVSAASYLKGS